MAAPTNDALLLTCREVAELLHVHPKQVYRLLKRGLPGRRVGGEWRFQRSEVLAWVGTDAAPAPSPEPTPAPPALLAANGDLVVHALLQLANAVPGPLWGFVQADRSSALRWLTEGRVLAAGSHGGLPPARVGAQRLARIHLVTREVGLVARPGEKPPKPGALAGLRIASRPRTAGIHAHLVAALQRAGVEPEAALAKAVALASHREVASAVLRGAADVGLCTRAWASACGLSFRKLADEGYGLLVRSVDLGAPPVVRLCETAQAPAFREALDALAGYDASGAGDIRYDPEDTATVVP